MTDDDREAMSPDEHRVNGERWLTKAEEIAKPGHPRTEVMDYAVMAQAHFLAAIAAEKAPTTTQEPASE